LSESELERFGLAVPPPFEPALDQPKHTGFGDRTWVAPELAPSPRGEHVLVCLPEVGSVLHGGWHDGESTRPEDDRVLADTWLWNGFEWQRLVSDETPPARYAHAGAYDLARREVVLHGGYDREVLHGDTWILQRRQWRRQAGPGPSPRMHHAMAYDPLGGRVVLFGGAGPEGKLHGDTWVYAAGWQRLEVSGRSARRGAAMAFDPRAGGLLLAGGDGEQGLLGDLWVLRGDAWEQLTPPEPAPRVRGASLTWIGIGTLRFGGTRPDTRQPTGMARLWTGSEWYELWPDGNLTPHAYHGATWNPSSRTLIVVGGKRDSHYHVFRNWEVRVGPRAPGEGR